jgi:TolB-like protein/Flp pilus assembly protein TadD
VITTLLFVALVQCPDGTPPPCRTAARPAAPAANTVAVLYFENQSRDTADAYLAVGLTEAIISKLGDMPRLTVKSRYLVRRYQGAAQADPTEIGRSLGVTYIVTGGVQRAGNRLRVTAEMARASNGNRVWGQQYERGDGDVFAIQEDIARGVATGVAGTLLPAERTALAARPTRNNEAYDHLLRGDVLLGQRTPATVKRAIGEYEAAVRIDPRMTAAWARIGTAEALRLDWGWGDGPPLPDSVLRRGLDAVQRAMALDSFSSDAWLAKGYLDQFAHQRDFAGAEAAIRRAVALNPRNAEAWQQLGDLLRTMRVRHPAADSLRREMIDAFRAALAIDPGRPSTLRNLSPWLPAPVRLAMIDSAIALEPGNYMNHLARVAPLLTQGDTVRARASLADASRLIPDGARVLGRSAMLDGLWALGDTAAARTLFRELRAELGPTQPIAVRTAAPLARYCLRTNDWDCWIGITSRVPPGAWAWYLVLYNLTEAQLTNPEVRRLRELSRPPWATAR